ncbi:hypothetical protein NECAME_13770 [Necator americanus]|uniref:Cleavage/polyadenylation specificity factor A subunit N-terminal domain-containing protein n=1 Tax=Necator americanus TaxID=51031 RepID=W2SVI4_NECAM|nr:hypothetical protein NECAME_13770 [Necator americanus]ETN72722.1 hypothetical protein NECAME_13770 [Necator americanus]
MFVPCFVVDEEKRAISSIGAYDDDLLWVHVRNYGVLLLGSDDKIRHTLKLSHCGYCRATMIGSLLVYPDTADEEHLLRFVLVDSGDRNRVVLKQLPLSIVSVDEVLFVGDEAGTITRISSEGKVEAEVTLFKDPVFCVAATSVSLACGSSKSPLVLVPTANFHGERRKIDYPQRQVQICPIIQLFDGYYSTYLTKFHI